MGRGPWNNKRTLQRLLATRNTKRNLTVKFS